MITCETCLFAFLDFKSHNIWDFKWDGGMTAGWFWKGTYSHEPVRFQVGNLRNMHFTQHLLGSIHGFCKLKPCIIPFYCCSTALFNLSKKIEEEHNISPKPRHSPQDENVMFPSFISPSDFCMRRAAVWYWKVTKRSFDLSDTLTSTKTIYYIPPCVRSWGNCWLLITSKSSVQTQGDIPLRSPKKSDKNNNTTLHNLCLKQIRHSAQPVTLLIKAGVWSESCLLQSQNRLACDCDSNISLKTSSAGDCLGRWLCCLTRAESRQPSRRYAGAHNDGKQRGGGELL